jgi:hypothetical protein
LEGAPYILEGASNTQIIPNPNSGKGSISLLKTHIINNNDVYFNLISKYYKVMISFLSLLSERREMGGPIKPSGFG